MENNQTTPQNAKMPLSKVKSPAVKHIVEYIFSLHAESSSPMLYYHGPNLCVDPASPIAAPLGLLFELGSTPNRPYVF